MSSNIESIWTSSTQARQTSMIIPDGCRDLIMVESQGNKAHCVISPLFDQSQNFYSNNHVNFVGFRLKPGTKINEQQLINTVEQGNISLDDIPNLIEDFTTREYSIAEALECLANDDVKSVKNASFSLGVNIRTLQRFVFAYTARNPSYWFQLARARKAAKALSTSMSLIDIAHMHDFSDQAHMSREFKRWFNLSPSEMIKRPDVMSQLNNSAYA